jgi:MFS family permease
MFIIPSAAAQNIQTMLVGRFLDGIAGSAFLSVAAGTVSDLFIPAQIQKPMMVYTLAPFFGPVLGPMVGGFINSWASWSVDPIPYRDISAANENQALVILYPNNLELLGVYGRSFCSRDIPSRSPCTESRSSPQEHRKLLIPFGIRACTSLTASLRGPSAIHLSTVPTPPP